MRMTRAGLALSSAMISCVLFAAVAGAQSSDRKAPRISLNTALGGAVASNYIEPSITLSEDAYVFAISVDVDRNIEVLHPAGTGISVKMTAGRQLQLPRFFAGFAAADQYSARSGMRNASYDSYGYSDTRGTIIALASRRPFDLSSISYRRDWDIVALRRLVDDRDPYAAASLLAKYLGARGEPIGRDVHRFAGGRQFYNSYYSNAAYYDCGFYSGGLGYARGFRSGYAISFFRAAQLAQAGYVVSFRGYDACGQPRFDVYPNATPGTPPGGQPPAAGSFPSGRLPSTAPRNPVRDQAAAGQTVFSRPTRGGYTDAEDAPSLPTRISEPSHVSERFHPQPSRETVSERPRRAESNPEPRGEAIQSQRPSLRETPPPTPERASQPVYTPARTEQPRAVSERPSPPAYSPPPERSAPPPAPAPAPARSEPVMERERPQPAPPPTPGER